MSNNYIKLSNYVSYGNVALVENCLKENVDIDLTCDQGKIFISPVENDRVDILNLLLNYFNNYQLSKYEYSSQEYSYLKNKLKTILEIASEDVELSDKMKDTLSSYLHVDLNDKGTEQDRLKHTESFIDTKGSISNLADKTNLSGEDIIADDISTVGATIGGYIQWDDIVQGKASCNGRYTQEYKMFCTQQLENILSTSNTDITLAAAIRNIQESLEGRIPSTSSLRRWYKDISSSTKLSECRDIDHTLTEKNLSLLPKSEIIENKNIFDYLLDIELTSALEYLQIEKLTNANDLINRLGANIQEKNSIDLLKSLISLKQNISLREKDSADDISSNIVKLITTHHNYLYSENKKSPQYTPLNEQQEILKILENLKLLSNFSMNNTPETNDIDSNSFNEARSNSEDSSMKTLGETDTIVENCTD